MIRAFRPEDMEPVLAIWLAASIQAHDFVAPDFWRAQLDNMRNLYLPHAEVYVYGDDAGVLGFYALAEDRLAAIFVAPDAQGKGIGKALLQHARTRRATLTLTVYQANVASVDFYRSQGFAIVGESLDEATGHEEYIMRI